GPSRRGPSTTRRSRSGSPGRLLRVPSATPVRPRPRHAPDAASRGRPSASRASPERRRTPGHAPRAAPGGPPPGRGPCPAGTQRATAPRRGRRVLPGPPVPPAPAGGGVRTGGPGGGAPRPLDAIRQRVGGRRGLGGELGGGGDRLLVEGADPALDGQRPQGGGE